MNDISPPPRGWLADLHLAAVFLTRLPLPDAGKPPPGGLAAAMRCFPLVGLGLGLAAGLAGMLAATVLPPLPSALLAVLALVLLTGALHEDGLADLADGLGARGGRDRRLEVMRDSRTGAFGVLALLFSVGLRATALAAMPGGWEMLTALAAAAALSRATIPAAMQIMAPARADGLGASAGVPDASVAAHAAGLGLVAAAVCLGLDGALAAACGALLGGLAVVVLARRAIGGYTGDVLGAVQQAAETGVLLAVAAALPRAAG
ncbi:adenosylcobinamide-GDP ribazoletransferase [Magnetospirillum sp. SS-4]|uniref:adenosylcobinamide-GDP ribazoletransferase n=1 Tax=Magnetospirillum sp. SS-4 TaxID=2681465 RepID=UPI001385590F|nr:adenosylcobinamide-GDP ribazoletransferase [Magnetospirillum sp. SS-4]CAA7615611.1 Cobalamin synthase [Magnetospirillum sp. SS-4]